MFKYIYCDMDDTLVDFTGGFNKFTDSAVEYGKDYPKAVFFEKFNDFINRGMFVNLEPLPEAEEFFNRLRNIEFMYGIQVILLSSTGREPFTTETICSIRKQKELWNEKNFTGSEIPMIIVSTHKELSDHAAKAAYSTPESILIDDSPRNIEGFKKNGGTAIHFTGNYQKVLDELSAILNPLD